MKVDFTNQDPDNAQSCSNQLSILQAESALNYQGNKTYVCGKDLDKCTTWLDLCLLSVGNLMFNKLIIQLIIHVQTIKNGYILHSKSELLDSFWLKCWKR